jgi:hypothetical protein
MRLLLDAHALIWSGDDPARVATPAMSAMQHPANELRLWLAENLAVPPELEASYEETCRVLRIA